MNWIFQTSIYFQFLLFLAILLAILFTFKKLYTSGKNPFATSLSAIKRIQESFENNNNNPNPSIERDADVGNLGDMQTTIFDFKTDNILYDDFYASIYD